MDTVLDWLIFGISIWLIAVFAFQAALWVEDISNW